MPPALRPTRVWDLPTGLSHWLLAACVIGSVISDKIGGNAKEWHFRLSYAILALLALRILWGLQRRQAPCPKACQLRQAAWGRAAWPLDTN